MRLIWKKQLWIIASLAIVLIIFSFVIWFHPSLGYIQSGILKGLDVRSEIIQILWILFGTLSLSSSIVIRIASVFYRHWSIWIIAYGLGIIAVIFTFQLIDKYY